jgi:hypothetical protein
MQSLHPKYKVTAAQRARLSLTGVRHERVLLFCILLAILVQHLGRIVRVHCSEYSLSPALIPQGIYIALFAFGERQYTWPIAWFALGLNQQNLAHEHQKRRTLSLVEDLFLYDLINLHLMLFQVHRKAIQ